MSFDDTFARVGRPYWLRNRFGSLVDRELPAEVEPFSFVPLAGLRELATALHLQADDTLVDLGCGRGGPGMWLARHTGAVLTGVDGSAVAVTQAADRAGQFGLAERSRFVVGDLADTGLPAASADGVVCIDAFMFAADVVACAREAHRLLRPGRHFVLTTWLPRKPGDPRLPDRYRDLDVAHALTTAGFTRGCLHRPVDGRSDDLRQVGPSAHGLLVQGICSPPARPGSRLPRAARPLRGRLGRAALRGRRASHARSWSWTVRA